MDESHPWEQYFHKSEDAFHGVVLDVDDCVDVVREFSYATSTSYAVTKCTKNFGQFQLENNDGQHNVRFHDLKHSHWAKITSDGIPFMLVGQKKLECHQGPHHRKTPSDQTKEQSEHTYSLAPSKNRLTGTKKRGCGAFILMKEILFFPQYKLPADTVYWRETKSAELRNDLLSTNYEDVEQMKFILIELPKQHSNHIMGMAADLKSPIDERVLRKLRALVDEGVFNAKEMNRHLKIFVKELFIGKDMPRIINRRFYPSKEDIRKIIYRQRRKTVHSLIDQENLQEKVRLWREDRPDDSWTLRMSSFIKRPLNEDEEDEEDGTFCIKTDESFLVVCQLEWQRRLLQRYGTELVYLDATYRTTRYALPLFFLCIQTNSGYCVVGSFIIEKEDSASVAEALQIICENNPDWSCRSFMIDASEIEANAIKRVFPEANIFICDFHRKQAWHRWLSTSKHDVVSQDETMQLLNAVAESCSEEKYHQAHKELLDSKIWQSQPKLQRYMESQWFSNKKHKMWVWAYRGKALTLVVNTNNGVEAQNKVFKHEYLASLPVKTVSSLMTALVEDFFVDTYRKYLLSNINMSSGWQQAATCLPLELHHRPPFLVQHIRSGMQKAADITSSMLTEIGEREFLVASCSSSQSYKVTLGEDTGNIMPECQCKEFLKNHLPCKHFCAVIANYSHLSWKSLPDFYFFNPHFVIDEECVNLSRISSLECTSESVPQEHQPSFELPHGKKRSVGVPSLDQSAKQVRELLQYIGSLTYIADSFEALEETRKQLSTIANELKEQCPASGSLLLEQPPMKKKKLTLTKKKKSSGPVLKPLPARQTRRLTKKAKKAFINLQNTLEEDTTIPMKSDKTTTDETLSNPVSPVISNVDHEETLFTSSAQHKSSKDHEIVAKVKDMKNEMSLKAWSLVTNKAKKMSSLVFDDQQTIALTVLDESCEDEDEQTTVLHQIASLAPPDLDMDSALQLSFMLLSLLVKQGRFKLKRNLAKEKKESAENMKGLIEALKNLRQIGSEYDTKSGTVFQVSSDKPRKKQKTVRFNLPSNAKEPDEAKPTKQAEAAGKSLNVHTSSSKDQSANLCISSKQGAELLDQILSSYDSRNENAIVRKSVRYYVGQEALELQDFQTLKQPRWLNDKIINAYLGVLQREQNLNNSNHIFVLPSYMAVLWDHGKLDQWLYSSVNFAHYNWIFLPVNVRRNHWVLLAANVPLGTVDVLDSMGGDNTSLKQKWISYMAVRASKTGQLENKKWRSGGHASSMQTDGNACGAFVMLNALVLSKNMTPLSISQDHAIKMREYVRFKLLAVSDEEPPAQRSKCHMLGCSSPRRAGWVSCSACRRWLHLPCANLAKTPSKHELYICTICCAQYR